MRLSIIKIKKSTSTTNPTTSALTNQSLISLAKKTQVYGGNRVKTKSTVLTNMSRELKKAESKMKPLKLLRMTGSESLSNRKTVQKLL